VCLVFETPLRQFGDVGGGGHRPSGRERRKRLGRLFLGGDAEEPWDVRETRAVHGARIQVRASASRRRARDRKHVEPRYVGQDAQRGVACNEASVRILWGKRVGARRHPRRDSIVFPDDRTDGFSELSELVGRAREKLLRGKEPVTIRPIQQTSLVEKRACVLEFFCSEGPCRQTTFEQSGSNENR
jgi:hypothetical protein